MRAVFRRPDGDLTPYAFACGYVQTSYDNRLFKDGCYHVQTFDGRWETFATLTPARAAFARAVKMAQTLETLKR